mmetsp:Transcript_11016/g.30756  ORF Transcript_11016/g.30756 Transcript_11016/m.30756 type:complete len:241 (+) Transcript_11016:1592-2314(+)
MHEHTLAPVLISSLYLAFSGASQAAELVVLLFAVAALEMGQMPSSGMGSPSNPQAHVKHSSFFSPKAFGSGLVRAGLVPGFPGPGLLSGRRPGCVGFGGFRGFPTLLIGFGSFPVLSPVLIGSGPVMGVVPWPDLQARSPAKPIGILNWFSHLSANPLNPELFVPVRTLSKVDCMHKHILRSFLAWAQVPVFAGPAARIAGILSVASVHWSASNLAHVEGKRLLATSACGCGCSGWFAIK